MDKVHELIVTDYEGEAISRTFIADEEKAKDEYIHTVNRISGAEDIALCFERAEEIAENLYDEEGVSIVLIQHDVI